MLLVMFSTSIKVSRALFLKGSLLISCNALLSTLCSYSVVVPCWGGGIQFHIAF